MDHQEVNPIIVVSWPQIYENLKKNFKGFDKAVFKQFAKKRVKEATISLEECLQRSSQENPELTVGLDGSALAPAIVCLDIDNAEVGARLITVLADPAYKEKFGQVLGDPLVIETPTANHLHLYYKYPLTSPQLMPVDAQNNVKSFKRLATTRLGFKAEYSFSQTTFSGSAYKILRGPVLSDVSELPKSLYPYNYIGRPDEKALVQAKGGLVQEGQRNTLLFGFFSKDNFTFNHVNLANLLCCQIPLEENEVRSLSLIPQRNQPVKMPEGMTPDTYDLHNETFSVFSFKLPLTASEEKVRIRLRPGEATPSSNYPALVKQGSLRKDTAAALAQVGFNPDRARDARLAKRTQETTILYVSLMEKYLDTFLDDSLWVGESLQGTACLMLMKTDHLQLRFVENEEVYYAYDKQRWRMLPESEVMSLITRLSQSLCKFQNIGSSTDQKAASVAIKTHASCPTWPPEATGFNFKNGSLILNDNKEMEFVKHDHRHNFRRLTKIDYNPNAYITPFEARFLLDFTNEQVYLLNLLRLILYSSLESGGNQLAAFITGDPGGSKRTLLSLIQRVVAGTVNVTNVNSLSQRFQLMGQVRGQNLLLFNDLAEDNIKGETAAVLKKLIAGEPVSDDLRYQGNYEFTPQVFVVFTTNFEAQDFETFQDPAMADRLLVTPASSIDSLHRINDFIERLGASSDNFSGIVNWALNLSADFPRNINRAGDLNNVISPAKTTMESFIFERLVYQPDNFLSFKTIQEYYSAFLEDQDSTLNSRHSKSSKHLSTRKVATLLRTFSKRLTSATPLIEKRLAKDRGMTNVGIRVPDQESLQQSFVIKTNAKISELLNSDPFKNHGILLRDPASTLYQEKPQNEKVEAATKLSAKAVIDVSSKMLMERLVVPDYEPHSHIQVSTPLMGPKVYQQPEWAQIPTIKPSDGLDPSIALDEMILRETAKLITQEDKLKPVDTNASPNLEASQAPKALPSTAEPESETRLLLENSQNRTEPKQSDLEVPKAAVLSKSPPSGRRGRKAKEEIKVILSKAEEDLLNVPNATNWDIFERLLDHNVGNPLQLRERCSTTFSRVQGGFAQSVELMQDKLDLVKLAKYDTFTQPYQACGAVVEARVIFTNFPIFGPIKLIRLLNEIFLKEMVRAFQIVKENRQPSQSEYFYRALPGTNTANKESENFKNLMANLPPEVGSYVSAQDKDFEWDGRSLLPLVYEKGDAGYGRLKSVPPSNLSSLKADLKRSVLKVASAKTGLKFVELDMRAAHTLVFKALTGLSPDEKAQFPSIDKQWSHLVRSFREILSDPHMRYDAAAKEHVLNWNDGQIKGLIKTQWYKALNSGSLFNPSDNIKNNKNKLNLTEDQVAPVVKTCQAVFEKIDLFKLLKAFQEKVNQLEYIYLPTQQEPFYTLTPSKKQVAKKLKDGGGELRVHGMTGMSRIFSSCELVLIMLVFVALSKIDNVLPIAYEADGLLLTGYFKSEKELLELINKNFTDSAQAFMDEQFSLEFKNLTSDFSN